ncbi:MAG: hypothetical protein AAGI90_06870, partial [Chlamydiota bacterium]
MRFSLVVSILLSLHLHAFALSLSSSIQKSLPLEEYVELHPFLHLSFEQANQAIGCQPLFIDVSQQLVNEIFSI